jgi:hypothetical protein
MTQICKKAAQDFHRAVSKVFDRVISVALWSANIRKLAKDHKGYGSAAMFCSDILLKDHLKKNKKTADFDRNVC